MKSLVILKKTLLLNDTRKFFLMNTMLKIQNQSEFS